MPTISSPPGPSGLPLLGTPINALRFMRDPALFMLRLYQRYGDVASLVAGKRDYLFVFSPDYNRQVLTDLATFYTGSPGTPPSEARLACPAPAPRMVELG